VNVPVDRSRVRTLYQTRRYAPDVDLRTDAVIIYGWKDDLAEEVNTWRARGYRVHFMTGAAWGGYSDYVNGDVDGRSHLHEAQVAANGERIDHGNEVFYFVPTVDYTNYLKLVVEKAIDAGVEAIHLEEPEFWVRGGYSQAFKDIWRQHYGFEWRAPHESPDNWHRAARLKYLMYTECLRSVFAHAKDYATRVRNAANPGASDLKCYVASHSLLNYAQWGIVSPESNLAHLDSCDGYVCQVWTGTARTPNHYGGRRAERTFETAYLEYAQMTAMVLSTRRSIWFLADPIEDDPTHDWDDYRFNYHATLVASLLNFRVGTFEVMPWPERVFRSTHPSKGAEQGESRIPPAYATELLTVSRALSEMEDQPLVEAAGISRVGVAISDTLLFERGWGSTPPETLRSTGDRRPPDLIYRIGGDADPEMDGFYGLALPLLKRGVFVRLAHLEHAAVSGYLEELDVIVLSYDFMKPPDEQAHAGLAEWVRGGGVLVYVADEGQRDFDTVDAWWRRTPHSYAKPVDHLWAQLGIDVSDESQSHEVGAGRVVVMPTESALLARSSADAASYAATVRRAYETGRRRDGVWSESGIMTVQRGRYRIIAALDEHEADAARSVFDGPYVDLFEPGLPVLATVAPEQGERYLLYDLSQAREYEVIAAAGRVESGRGTFEDPLLITAPEGIAGQVLILVPGAPKSVRLAHAARGGRRAVTDLPAWADWSYDPRHQILRVNYEGSPDGTLIAIQTS
jgi:hypothetical protein